MLGIGFCPFATNRWFAGVFTGKNLPVTGNVHALGRYRVLTHATRMRQESPVAQGFLALQGFARVCRREQPGKTVNRLVAGSNPARGAKSQFLPDWDSCRPQLARRWPLFLPK